MKKCCRLITSCMAAQVASQFREESMKETDILGHVPCSTLPQKDYNIDLSDTLEDMCWTCLARFYLSIFMNNS